MITINFYTTLRLMLKCREIEINPSRELSVPELLEQAETVIEEKLSKKFIWKLLEADGTLKRGTIIMINGKNILDSKGLSCTISDGDVIALFPPGGGG